MNFPGSLIRACSLTLVAGAVTGSNVPVLMPSSIFRSISWVAMPLKKTACTLGEERLGDGGSAYHALRAQKSSAVRRQIQHLILIKVATKAGGMAVLEKRTIFITIPPRSKVESQDNSIPGFRHTIDQASAVVNRPELGEAFTHCRLAGRME